MKRCGHPQHPLEAPNSKLERVSLYETSTYYYLVGFDAKETHFRLLKINRLVERPKELSDILREDSIVYSRSDIADILEMINEGNRTSGGLIKICTSFGLVGFVKFLDCYYFTLITQRKEVGCIAGNLIYSIKATEIFPVRRRDAPESNAFKSLWKKLNKKLNQTSAEIAESRYMGLFQFVDMSKDFFYSYTYDLTNSLQKNFVGFRSAAAVASDKMPSSADADGAAASCSSQEMFEWNHYQLEGLQSIMEEENRFLWALSIVHGSFQQRRFSLFGQSVDMIVLARRSRHYAGTRYLKRGVNVHGKAANDCEVEQIVQLDNGYRANFCSYLQMRGSIPTYWYQETSVTMPKPPILINRVDPDYLATEEHIAHLFRRYSSPLIVLDLVKQHERRPRESIVGREFRQAIEVINQSISSEHKLRYLALDYSKITSISKAKAKAARQGSSSGGSSGGMRGSEKPAERAMQVVGNEWAMMESSLTTDKSAAAREKEAAATPPKQQPVRGSVVISKDSIGTAAAAIGVSGTTTVATAAGKAAAVVSGAVLNSQELKIDVLRELEDIAGMTIADTGFFCNTTHHLDRVRLLPAKKKQRAAETGYLEQRGVLRTNCIDCLDRTNGAQFAVAMKFLQVSLRALGVCSAQQVLEPSSRLLLSLMEMYGEMGDKIALQYGGSEAHRKVPGGQAVSQSKQSELLTSIKRYYSNAFTDMVKQDAMNVFLGCFVPGESNIPLWDLETDYHLHNHALRPPVPSVNRVLFERLVQHCRALQAPPVRHATESAVKKALLALPSAKPLPPRSKPNYIAAAAVDEAGATDSVEATSIAVKAAAVGEKDGTSLDKNDSSAATAATAVAETTAVVSAALSVPLLTAEAVAKLLPEQSTAHDFTSPLRDALKSGAPHLQMQDLLRRYHIASLLHETRDSSNSSGSGSSAASVTAGTTSTADEKRTVATTTAVTTVVAPKFRTKSELHSAIRAIARLERRKFLRRLAYAEVSNSAVSWWQHALDDFELGLYGPSRTPVVLSRTNALTDTKTGVTGSVDALQENYFDRCYKPHQLTEFDSLLSLDFNAPVDVIDPDRMRALSPSVAQHDGNYGGRSQSTSSNAQAAVKVALPAAAVVVARSKSSEPSAAVGARLVAGKKTSSPPRNQKQPVKGKDGSNGGERKTGASASSTAATGFDHDSEVENGGEDEDDDDDDDDEHFVERAARLSQPAQSSSMNYFFYPVAPLEEEPAVNADAAGVAAATVNRASSSSEHNSPLTVMSVSGPSSPQTIPITAAIDDFVPSQRTYSAAIDTATVTTTADADANTVVINGSGAATAEPAATGRKVAFGETRDSASATGRVMSAGASSAAAVTVEEVSAEGNNSAESTITGFYLSRYVREIGMKARTLVGGFLRKDETQSSQRAGPGRSISKHRDRTAEWNWQKHLINFHMHRVPRSSSLLYARYVSVAENSLLLLLEAKGAGRVAEEEYFSLLRDYSVDIDNVAGMEHLSIESYVSDEIIHGSYQGMNQRDSAFMAHGYLMTSLIQVESELLACSVQDEFTSAVNDGSIPSIAKVFPSVNVKTVANTDHAAASSGTGTAVATGSSSATQMKAIQSQLLRSALEIPEQLQYRIDRGIERAQVARGLEVQLKKNINNFVFQQYTYSKDISPLRLANRLPALTSEKVLLEYAYLFDHESLAFDFDEADYYANDSPIYESFSEMRQLQQSLAPLRQALRERKRKLCGKVEKSAVVAAETATVFDNGVSSIKGSSSSSKDSDVSVAQYKTSKRRPRRDELFRAPASSIEGGSISNQLGLSTYDGLLDDLSTDFSLPSLVRDIDAATASDSSSESKSNSSGAVDVLRLPYPYDSCVASYGLEQEHAGFTRLQHDLYARDSNPFLHMNEIAVMQFSATSVL